MKTNRLPGHELPNEGRLQTPYGPRNHAGQARCTCGAASPVLPNTAARKQWHREHKDQIRAAQEAPNA